MKLKSVVCLIITGGVVALISGFIGYNLRNKNTKLIKEIKTEDTCSYVIPSNYPKEYFSGANNSFEIVLSPKLIENPQVVKINEVFNEKDYAVDFYNNGKPKTYFHTENFDVDGDGKDETSISADTGINRNPNDVLLIKDGKIIFKKHGENIVINETYSHNGFILEETTNRMTEAIRIRYLYKNGGFIPVWSQKICWISTN